MSQIRLSMEDPFDDIQDTGVEVSEYEIKHYKDQHEIMNDMVSEIRKRKRDDAINKIIND